MTDYEGSDGLRAYWGKEDLVDFGDLMILVRRGRGYLVGEHVLQHGIPASEGSQRCRSCERKEVNILICEFRTQLYSLQMLPRIQLHAPLPIPPQ